VLDSQESFASHYELGPSQREALRTFDRLLLETNAHTNLIARSTTEQRWERHYADSAQLLPLMPDTPFDHLDIGSGAGFPGVVLRILTMDREDTSCTFCDSVQKKAAFLSQVVTEARLPRTKVLATRLDPRRDGHGFDVITARAVTALPGLIALVAPRLKPGGMLIAPKGRRAQEELDAARKAWSFDLETVPSQTDPSATILLIREPKALS
jgi:16S rRNA (guanine527-N7)-methyltransferase